MTTGNEKPPILDRTKTAMIVVDMQNGFLDDEGSITKAGMDITELKRAVGPVQRLVDACHATQPTDHFYSLRAACGS